VDFWLRQKQRSFELGHQKEMNFMVSEQKLFEQFLREHGVSEKLIAQAQASLQSHP
jgi:hypothetical protein